MVSKTIKAVLTKKLNDWIDSIPQSESAVRKAIKENVFITGGALVNMLQGEAPNDFDVYFRTREAAVTVGEYYVKMFNARKKTGVDAELQQVIWSDKDHTTHYRRLCKGSWIQVISPEKFKELKKSMADSRGFECVSSDAIKDQEYDAVRVRVFLRSQGVATEDGRPPKDDELPEDKAEEIDILQAKEDEDEKPRYRPVFMSSNAITLSNKIQLVMRFYGEPEQVHLNYDFVHCTCYWKSWDNEVVLPSRALEAIMNKELHYVGSKYPLCSIIRSRKFISRGWHINAGQYLKMVLQLQELDLLNPYVFEEQLTGVDSFYFSQAIEYVKKKVEEDENFKPNVPYLISIINQIF